MRGTGPRLTIILLVASVPAPILAQSTPPTSPIPSAPTLPQEPPLPALRPTPPAAPTDPSVAAASTSDRVPDRPLVCPSRLDSLPIDPGREAAQVAARVGDTIITVRELKRAIRDRLGPNSSWNQLSREHKDALGRSALDALVDRALILQAARKKFDKPKQWETFREYFETLWTDRELPALLRRFHCENEIELRRKLESLNDSLDERRETFLQEQMARAYLSEILRHKVAPPDFRQIYGYYRSHRNRFDRPAEITWREIRLSADRYPDHAQRRARAEQILTRLQLGDDFASLARQFSDSPKASAGGLWKTSPGGFASQAVNDALERLAPGQISGLIDDPKAIYIIRLEHRRPAGPAPFEEVQTEIAEALQGQAFEAALDRYLRELKAVVPISYPLLDPPTASR